MSQQPPSDDTPRGRPSSSGASSSGASSGGIPPGGASSGAGGSAPRRSPYDASPYDHELSTDPGRPHAYESLYRGSQDRGRPTPRHWEPNLNPPETAGDDTYGWLYRPEVIEPSGRSEDTPAPRPWPSATPATVARPSATPAPAPRPSATSRPAQVDPPPRPIASRPVDPRPTPAARTRTAEPSRPAPRRRGQAVLTVLLVLLVLGAAAAAGMIWQS